MASPNEVIYKKDLVAELADKEEITKVEAERRIDIILDMVIDKLGAGKDVKLANFFNFFNRKRKEKNAKNPQTGEDMVIRATKTVVAKMTKPLKDRIQGKK
ncbi:HU family DNA-binding protein [Paenibacillus sp. D2_2]|uniref:HU family DNA-binding protein n=1 Tax=Paenibacillus sp. D2_2 TaxID=3073092 RepID=UPI0028154000|nr:HU family DNA-binding protein [Paenibacillus sp. D2_2]WMT39250.1 HU family DNA-binding protein [Paenibacillus sp. D2_2]